MCRLRDTGGAAGARGRPDRVEYADYLLAIGYTEQELQNMVAARAED
ncbi:hypothetical protein GCM10023321_13180 [Pseudonocardia eucalypti]|uniref:Uncharacterized protein n=1 Tax=Pseudonocardia eucalypti TaxID=648755 RepID=A0ABP9PNA0_9PSEU|nr:hypothetical protein [Pseudonocardia eucalypti]